MGPNRFPTRGTFLPRTPNLESFLTSVGAGRLPIEEEGEIVAVNGGYNMSETPARTNEPASVQIAVPVGRNVWVRKQATLHYQGKRLVKAEGVDFGQAGPQGLTGILYLVKASLNRDNRSVMRVERQKIVNGQVVQMQNWGEIEETALTAA
jgi:hypothetical protein